MITNLVIEGFKIHKSTELPLSNLNILTGVNSSGKSSVIQSLLLLRQTFNKQILSEGLQLQGDLCNIGLVDDAICQYANEDVISIEINERDKHAKWRFKKKSQVAEQDFLVREKTNNEASDESNLILFSKKFQYIGASRLAPQESYPLDTNAVEIRNQISDKNGQCELVVHYLDYYKSKGYQINKALRHPTTDSLNLIDQVSAWESEISQSVNVIPEKFGKAFLLKYSYYNPTTNMSTKGFSATNVGYGLSYALPIIVALLTAEKDGLIVIENPEAHLHPSGQAALARLIAKTAQAGVQIIVETHSDHILNGILVASKKFEECEDGIDKENVSIFYFVKNEQTQIAEVKPIKIVGDGKIDTQPIGFFDQTERDLSFLLGF